MTIFSTLYTLSAVLALLVLIILGDVVNMSVTWCRGLLLNQSVKMWHQSVGNVEAKNDRLEIMALERSIVAVEKYLQIHDSLFPVRLLGIRASRTLIVTLVLGAASAFGVAVNIIFAEVEI